MPNKDSQEAKERLQQLLGETISFTPLQIMKADDRNRDTNEPTGYLFVGIGRKGGVRPGDLVGAIANESGLEGRQIGPIRISDNFSVVGVPERKVDDVIGAMHTTMIRGKKTSVRRYTD